MEKISRQEVEDELLKLGVSKDAVDGILSALSLRSLSELEGKLLIKMHFVNIIHSYHLLISSVKECLCLNEFVNMGVFFLFMVVLLQI